MSEQLSKKAILPEPASSWPQHASEHWQRVSTFRFNAVTALAFICACALTIAFRTSTAGLSLGGTELGPFYSHVVRNSPELCPAGDGRGVSYSGHVGLEGDSEDTPKRSFFWYFEAQRDHENAPVILTIGGGPGTSGHMNPMFGQSHCIMTANGTVSNPNAWSEHYNVVALDHPIGVGFSYGTHVNTSRSAALDAYDFLQKFYVLFPRLLENKLVLSGGSYGGMYVPNIATVIHEQNLAIAEGRGKPGAAHLNLEVLLISNPMTDVLSWFQYVLHYRCYLSNVYNSTQCTDLYSKLPNCFSSLEYATEVSDTIPHRHVAFEACRPLMSGDTHGTLLVDVRKHCDEDPDDPRKCIPEFGWFDAFFNDPDVKRDLGVPSAVNFTGLSQVVNAVFNSVSDMITRAHVLYEPLLAAGIRLLHYIGAQDANCAWPATLAFLKLIKSPFQDEFISTPDTPLPWEGHNATVRAIGPSAGNQTYILIQGAGHFVVRDQPALVKKIVEHFIDNVPYM